MIFFVIIWPGFLIYFLTIEKTIGLNKDGMTRGYGCLGERMIDIYLGKAMQDKKLKSKEPASSSFRYFSGGGYFDRESYFNNDQSKEKFKHFVNANKGKELYFYGAGFYSKKLLEKFDLSELNILGFIDLDTNKRLQKIGDYTIYSTEDLEKLNPDTLVLSVQYKDTVLPELQELKNKKGYKFEIDQDLAGDYLL